LKTVCTVDPALVGSIKFDGTSIPRQWNSGGMPGYDVVMVLERRNGPRPIRDHDDGDDIQWNTHEI